MAKEVHTAIPRRQKRIRLRLEPDVLGFFERLGPDYKLRMNAVLRSYMQRKRKKRA
jgi:uncharacterized protein (DUF4415 family)